MPVHQVSAGVWGEDMMVLALEIAQEIIMDLANAALNIVALETVNYFLTSNIFDGAPSYIIDYRDFLFHQPRVEAGAQAEVFLTYMLRNRIAGNYNIQVDSDFGDSYQRDRLYAASKKAVNEMTQDDELKTEVTIGEFCTEVDGKLLYYGEEVDPDFGCLVSILYNTANHPEGAKNAVREYVVRELDRQLLEKREKCVDGYCPTEAEGIIQELAIEKKLAVNRAKDSISSGAMEIANSAETPFGKLIVSAAMPIVLGSINKVISEETRRLAEKTRRELKDFSKRQSTKAKFREGSLPENGSGI